MQEARAYHEFFRADTSVTLRRFLVPATTLLTVGPPLILFSATAKQMPHHEIFGPLGAALMMAGLVTGFGGIAVLLLEDRYVAVIDGGLVVHVDKSDTFVAWEDLEALTAVARGLEVHPRGAEPLQVPFSEKRAKEVIARLEDWRRKAAFDLKPL